MKVNSIRCYRVLLLDLPLAVQDQVGDLLRAAGDAHFQLFSADLGDEWTLTPAAEVDCVLVDPFADASSGPDPLRELRSRWPHAALVALGAADDERQIAQAFRHGADDFVDRRRLSTDRLEGAIRHACQQAQHRRQQAARTAELEHSNRRLRDEIAALHSRERQMIQTVPQIMSAASSEQIFALWSAAPAADDALDRVPALVVMLDAQGRVVRYNRFVETLTGYTLSEAAGQDWFERFLPTEQRAAGREVLQAAFTDAVSPGRIGTIVTKTGLRREIAWWGKRIDDPHGRLQAVLALGHDVTELYDAQARALQAERLAAIGDAMTGLAHESRNALQRSQANLEMLAREVDDRPQALAYIRRIQQAQDDLHQLYENVREYATPIRLQLRTENVAQLLCESWEQLAPHRVGRAAQLAVDEGGLDPTCEVDRPALLQVFRHLLENALAACPDPVAIEVDFAEIPWHGGAALRITLRDNGPELTEEVRRRMFDVFFTTKTHGAGLGLAAARRLIEAHHGALTLGLESPRGAEFWLTLPRRTS